MNLNQVEELSVANAELLVASATPTTIGNTTALLVALHKVARLIPPQSEGCALNLGMRRVQARLGSYLELILHPDPASELELIHREREVRRDCETLTHLVRQLCHSRRCALSRQVSLCDEVGAVLHVTQQGERGAG